MYMTLHPDTMTPTDLCCGVASKQNTQGIADKCAWLRERMAEGLVFTKLPEGGKVFVEHLPAEVAWVPIVAPSYRYINCLWVSGSFAKHGHGKALLEGVVEHAKGEGQQGLCITAGSAKKQPFLSDPKFLKHMGFVAADEAQGRTLWALPLAEGVPLPRYADSVRGPQPSEEGLVIRTTVQCPYTNHYVGEVLEAARQMGMKAQAHKITTREEAQRSPVPWTTYAAWVHGQYLGEEIYSAKSFATKLSKLGIATTLPK